MPVNVGRLCNKLMQLLHKLFSMRHLQVSLQGFVRRPMLKAKDGIRIVNRGVEATCNATLFALGQYHDLNGGLDIIVALFAAKRDALNSNQQGLVAPL